MDINRILHIDADSQREAEGGSFLTIKYAYSTDGERPRQPNPDIDLEQDMIVLTYALAAIILKAEKEGWNSGEAISFVIGNLQNVYVDANMKTLNEKMKVQKINSTIIRSINSGL